MLCVFADFPFDAKLDAKLTGLASERVFVLHDAQVYNITPAQIVGLRDDSQSKMFVIDARAQANWDEAMQGFDVTRDCVVRWSLVGQKLFPRYCRPVHNAHRFPDLCSIVAPDGLPSLYIGIQSFEDGAQFQKQRKILHHTLRVLNMAEIICEELDQQHSLFFAEASAFGALVQFHLFCHCLPRYFSEPL